jgi:hypothetical protein
MLLNDGQQTRVCNADKALIQCLGDQFDSCISTAYLQSIGISEYDAIVFVDYYKQLEQICTSHLFKSISNAKCEPGRFDQCTDQFAKDIGLPKMPTDYIELFSYIEELLQGGEQEKVCIADRALIKCFGDEYVSCISVDFLKSIGESEKDAQGFVALAKRVEQACRPVSFKMNAQCDNTKFSQCTDTFAKSLGLPAMPTDATKLVDQINKLFNGGQKSTVCNADKALIDCLGDQYDSCISVDYLKSIGESEFDADLFVYEATLVKTICSIPVPSNAQCDNSRFQQCTDTLPRL